MGQIKPGTRVHQLFSVIKDWPKAFTVLEIVAEMNKLYPREWGKSAIRAAFIKLEDYGKIGRTEFKRRAPHSRAKELLWHVTTVPLDVALDGVAIAGRRRTMSQAVKQKYERQTERENPNKESKTMAELIRTEKRNGEDVEIWYDGPAMTKTQAFDQDLTRYFKPEVLCLRKHVSERLTSNGACIACQTMRNRKIAAEKKTKRKAGTYKPTKRKLQKYKTVKVFKPKTITSADRVRAIIAAKGDKAFTTASITHEMNAAGNIFSQKSANLVMSRLKTLNEIEATKTRMGRYQLFKATKQFWEINANKKAFFLEINKDSSLDIKMALDKVDANIVAQEEAEHKKEFVKKEKAAVPDFQVESTPVALIGRALFEYMNELRTSNNYDAHMQKIEDLKAAVSAYVRKYDDMVAKYKELSEKHNDTMLKNHALKTKLHNQEIKIIELNEYFQRRQSGTFSLGEQAKITGLFDGLKFPNQEEASV